MADIFGSFPAHHNSMAGASRGGPGPTHGGGRPSMKQAPYSPPKGPINQGNCGPGLHGNNYGNCGSQGHHVGASTSGSPGIGGSNHGNRGSQR